MTRTTYSAPTGYEGGRPVAASRRSRAVFDEAKIATISPRCRMPSLIGRRWERPERPACRSAIGTSLTISPAVMARTMRA
jgi:hypothetical protein